MKTREKNFLTASGILLIVSLAIMELFLGVRPARSQVNNPGVTTQGAVTPGNVAVFVSAFRIRDGGTLPSTFVTSWNKRTGAVVPATNDYNFNQLAGSIACSQYAALTGDITTPAGSCATTLATVNSNVGSFGSTTQCVTVTANGKGLITAISAAACAPPFSAVTGQLTLAQFPDIADLRVLANISGGATVPAAVSITALFDATLCNTNGQVASRVAGVWTCATPGTGDVVGPGSATDNAVARFDSTTGKLIQNSVVIVGDTGVVTGVVDLTASGTVQGANVTATSALTGATAAGAMIATQAEQETGSATDKLVTPGRQQFHASAAKFWIYCTQAAGTYTIQASYNNSTAAGCGKSSTGILAFAFTVNMSSANYPVVCSSEQQFGTFRVTSKSASGFTFEFRDPTGVTNTDTAFSCVAFGDQ